MPNRRERTSQFDTATQIQEAYGSLAKLEQEHRIVSNPAELETVERELRAATDTLAALLLQKHVQASLETREHTKKEREFVSLSPATMKHDGYESVRIQTATGLSITIQARYYRCMNTQTVNAPSCKGVYAGLGLLGIHGRCTPLLASMVSSWAALLRSFEEVRQVLSEHGVELGVKVLRRITYRYAERARAMQQREDFDMGKGSSVAGRRVVISCDGGRLRLRENKTGKTTQKGRTPYRGAWREPKLLIIYVIDSEGTLDKRFAPIIDGCIQGPDALFRLLQSYLSSLKIHEAAEVLFVADGAHWIWNRVSILAKTLGVDMKRVHELLDFYHAVEHLAHVASLRKNWTVKQRKAWVRQHRRLLKHGQSEQVIQAVQALCRGRHSKAITAERRYFARNQHRMAYDKVQELKLPLGSGAVESAVRRVINLRMKGPGIFWYKEHAEHMLMLRSYFKAGRWNVLKRMANSPHSLWVLETKI